MTLISRNDYRNMRYCLRTLLVGWALCGVTSSYGEPGPGELLEVKVPAERGAATIRFRFCPPGELLLGRPSPVPEPTGNEVMDRLKRGARVAEMKAFYISEGEMSQRTYAQLMGDEAVDLVFKRLLETDQQGRGQDYPIYGVHVFEAAAFCAKLKELDADKAQATSDLETRQFRLPSHCEWQYACRAVVDVKGALERPHFSEWPKLDDIEQPVRVDCEEAWKKAGESAQFTGSQEQVAKILEFQEDQDFTFATKLRIIDAFLQKALGTARSYREPPPRPEPVRTGRPNAWNIYNMHGNVFEWTIAERDGVKLAGITKQLISGEEEQFLTMENPAVFFLAGGGYNHSLGAAPDDWVKFSTWGGEGFDVEARQAKPYSLKDIEEQKIIQDIPAGFRVVLERVLSPSWLLVIRRTALPDVPQPLDGTLGKLREQRVVIGELASPSERDGAQAAVDYYVGLARYHNGSLGDSAQAIVEPLELLAQSDPYFSYLGELHRSDAAGRTNE